jgi:DNA-binding GntR family transcriptional regulator
MRLTKISTRTMRQVVYDRLREKIISAKILPGELISIRDLASEFGVSMMPVREALWQLESEKAIVIKSNKSIRVNKLTAKEMEELLRLRLLLEPLAAERSCERRPESAVPMLKSLMKGMGDSIGRAKRFTRLNNEFHLTIYSFADSPLLLHIINLLWARVSPYLFIQDTRGDLSDSMRCHQEMYEAFSRKDPRRLTAALRGDMEGAARFIIPLLEEDSSEDEIVDSKDIDLQTLRKKIYDQLKRKIISAEILPGESMNTRDLAREFGVSTMPVREALWQLESEKVIVIERNRGIQVSKLTSQEMEEALRIRLTLEPLAAERSCERRSDGLLPKMKSILDSMRLSIENPRKYMKRNSQFHFSLYSYADSPLLLSIIDWLWARVGPYLWIQAMKVDDLSTDWEYHREMYEAFADRNKKRLREALRLDLEDAARVIRPFLEQ